jgi:hypothetical protein
MEPQMERVLIVVVVILVALIAALLAGFLKWLDGGRVIGAIAAGTAAFAAAVPVVVLLMKTGGIA